MFDRQQSIREAAPVDLSVSDAIMPANKPTRAFYVGGGGSVTVELVGNPGVAVTYTVQSGSRHSVQVSKFIKSLTTATGIVAEF
jgi:hypothetical protein